ncbi:MAG: BTAD domain-containing putative transcriptional regulator [Actinomycetota bacterium]|nr:BTAD domain-containing putative transcriptional regulator [Actinomycetota bacterium]
MLGLYRSGRHAEALRVGHDFRRALGEETGLEPTDELRRLERMIVERDPRLDERPRGRKLRGYVLGPMIGHGPVGATFLAHQPSVGRDVAITVVAPEDAADPEFVQRFEVHAQRIAAVEHPNVVPLYDYWRDPDGAYLVARHLDGGTLAQRLAAPDPFDARAVIDLVEQVGAALSAAHARGVAHGRLDAGSVHFDGSGTAYLADFGLGAGLEVVPTDIEALAQLAGASWAKVPEPDQVTRPRAANLHVGAADAVERVLERVTGGERALGYSSVPELVAGFRAAALGQHTDGPVRSARGPEPAIEGPNPYRGLAAFDETDAPVFFGREDLAEVLEGDLVRDRFLAVVGPSGSGKSSVVRAGLLPRLRARGALIAAMAPGRHPLAELEMALSRVATSRLGDVASVLRDDPGALGPMLSSAVPGDAPGLVLVLDQFEELYTLAEDAERAILLRALVEAVDSSARDLRLVATMRADFLGHVLDDPVIGTWVREHTRLIAPLRAEDLHRAITGPAEAAGVAVEPALAATLVADADDMPGALPLLQYALTELYEHRVEGTMTVDALRRLGGLTGVLRQRAEEIHDRVGSAGYPHASRQLFTRLVAPGDGAEDARRRALRSELRPVPVEVIDAYGAARLLVFDRDPSTREPTVEVAHEALIREWPRLRGWLDDDRDGLRILRRLGDAAREWLTAERDPGELYRGARLVAAVEWASVHRDELSGPEAEFLDASVARREAELERERRGVRRLRTLATIAAIVAIVALIAGVVAVDQRSAARSSAADAELRRMLAESQSAIDEDRTLALLLALEANAIDPSLDTLGAVQRAVVGAPGGWLGDLVTGRNYLAAGFLDDETLVAAAPDGVEVWDLVNRTSTDIELGIDGISDLDLGDDGRLLAVGGADGEWTVLDTGSFEQVAGGRVGAAISVVRVGPGGEVIGLGRTDGVVRLRGIADPSLDRDLRDGLDGAVTDLAFRADGGLVAGAASFSHPARQWDTRTGALVGPELWSQPDDDDNGVGPTSVAYVDDRLHGGSEVIESFDPITFEPSGSPIRLPSNLLAGGLLERSGPSELTIAAFNEIMTIDLSSGEVELRTFDDFNDAAGGTLAPDGSTVAFYGARGLSLWALDGAGLAIDATVPSTGFLNQITSDGHYLTTGG